MLLIPTKISYTAAANESAAEEIPIRVELTVDDLIRLNSARYGVSEWLIRHIIKHESAYDRFAEGDDYYFCRKTGQIAPSYGLVQISSCWHPQVTYEQATDPAFAIEFLASHLADGRCYLWSTCPL